MLLTWCVSESTSISPSLFLHPPTCISRGRYGEGEDGIGVFLGPLGPLLTTMYKSNLLMLMEFPNEAFYEC